MFNNSDMGRQYNAIKNIYDVNYESPSQSNYNNLKNSIFELKSNFILPNPMYNKVNDWQQKSGERLGGLENKLLY